MDGSKVYQPNFFPGGTQVLYGSFVTLLHQPMQDSGLHPLSAQIGMKLSDRTTLAVVLPLKSLGFHGVSGPDGTNTYQELSLNTQIFMG